MTRLLVVLLLWLGIPGQSHSQSLLGIFPALQLSQDSSNHQLENLQAIGRDNNKVLLRWHTLGGVEESYFDIERSSNGTDYSLIGVIKFNGGGWFEYTDEAAPSGKIFYRVKCLNAGSVLGTGLVTTSVRLNTQCRFYPNPVDQVLIVRSEGPVDLQISDPSGKPVLSGRLTGGLKIQDVSTLAPGVYVISIFQKDGTLLLSEKLVKK